MNRVNDFFFKYRYYSMFVLMLCILSIFTHSNFKEAQLKHQRVKDAYASNEGELRNSLELKGINLDNLNLFIQAYKKEQVLEVWLKNKEDKEYQRLQSIPFSAFSGWLGPKRKQGDLQIPEGLYHIDRFNPESKFHLSLGINYPNASDRLRSPYSKLGGDIFIHGDKLTIGCIPLGDAKIEELYILAIEAKQAGQNEIPVFIYPSKFEDDWLEWADGNTSVEKLWKELKSVHDQVVKTKKPPSFSIDKTGAYLLTR